MKHEVMHKLWFGMLMMLCFSASAMAATIPLDVRVRGDMIAVDRSFQLTDVEQGKDAQTAITIPFKSEDGTSYQLDISYKALPSNRSFPSHLDLTLRDGSGNKLGYLFFANNGVAFLKRLGVLGLIVDVGGKSIDIRLSFDGAQHRNNQEQVSLRVSSLGNERFIQDTLVAKFHFQMIRPVILPEELPGLRSQTYVLDHHPYAVNFTLEDQAAGGVRFKHQLYRLDANKGHVLTTVYFDAVDLSTLRQAMYAAKYFDPKDGVFKLVFYPAMGQTSPPK
jgi:hypothetical protein